MAVARTAERKAGAAGSAERTASGSGARRPEAAPRFKGRRSRIRRAGERAVGMALLLRLLAVWAVVLVLLGAAAWSSWQGCRDAVLGGRERGVLTVRSCDPGVCRGSFVPDGADGASRLVSVARSEVPAGGRPGAGGRAGVRLAVALRPGTSEAVRTGWAGVLHAWIPFGGALLLGAALVGAVLRWRRTAWAGAVLGAAVLGGAFAVSSS
ncbi:hypothetical protein LO771_16330 [Streptacidiphilus sp. ASG 303]|uniref:hypothetical protein n=1 Tax=Streptacidiphilus sp. ASG 303 TaxID=2896847 RepID=UPI001E3582C2|nr:hypothetical protein [Streptacidiphilus sp. ASG 303]MCD0483919.1 hypothetical protein [Streptacidiphilus sp. ASG 303]